MVPPSPALPYQCPGETYAIEKAIHLGRLARAYPECRHCVHRFDPDALHAGMDVWSGADQDGDGLPTLFATDSAGGVYPNHLRRDDVMRLATAFGALLRQDHADEDALTVVVASDGRPLTAELSAAASEGLRMMGCEVIDIGFATAPCLASAVKQLSAKGGLLLGNRRSASQHVGISFWSRHARPLYAPGPLDRLRSIYAAQIARPVRRFGNVRRFRAEEPYLDGLREHYHALRPLRVVLQTACAPIGKYLTQLTASAACEFARIGRDMEVKRSDRQGLETDKRLQERVVTEHAHFGVWIDGDGLVVKQAYQGKHPFTQAPGQIEMHFGEYKEIEGRQVPHRRKMQVDGEEIMNISVEAYEFNPEVDETLFEKPEA